MTIFLLSPIFSILADLGYNEKVRIRTLKEAPLRKGTRVIVRADLDVGVRNGRVVDDLRIQAGLPTIRYLLRRGANVRIVGHLGRPHGKRDKKLSLRPVARQLEKMLKRKVVFLSDPLNKKSIRRHLDSKDIIFFENIRFWPEEVKNNMSFARRLADWGHVYVNDAFANSHRREASVVALAALLPSYAGLRLAREVSVMEKVLKNPVRPLVVIVGGVKLETKLPVVRSFLKSADKILVGGAIANEMLRKRPPEGNKKIVLPRDGVGNKRQGFGDIGPKTIRLFVSLLRQAKTVIWNGPLGRAEIPKFAEGTKAVARALARSNAFTVVGGGDTIAILRRCRLLRGFDHVSTGGGAMLEFLAGKKLPGVEALKRKA